MLIQVVVASGLGVPFPPVSYTEIELDRQFQIEREAPAQQGATLELPGSCRDLAMENAAADGPMHKTGWTRISLGDEAVVVWCDMDTAYGGIVGGWTLVWSNLRCGSGKLATDMPWHKAIDSLPQYKMRSGGRPRTLEDFEVYTGLDQIIALGDDIAPGDEDRTRGELRYVWAPDFKADRALIHDAACAFTIDPADNYKIDFAGSAGSGCNQILGSELPGLFKYHDSRSFSATDRDNDNDDEQCASRFSGTPFWYKNCWEGSFWGRGEYGVGSHRNGAHWDGNTQEWSSDAIAPKGAGNGWLFVR